LSWRKFQFFQIKEHFLQNIKDLNGSLAEILPNLTNKADELQANMKEAYLSNAETKMKLQQ